MAGLEVGWRLKGRLVFAEGRLQSQRVDGQDGARRYTTDVDTVQALGPRPQRDQAQRGELEHEAER